MDAPTQAVLDVARGVLAELDLDVVLDRVLEAAQTLTEARYAALGVLNEPRTELARFLTRGIDETTRSAIGPLPRGRGVLGALIEEPVPLRLADVGRHPRSYGFPHGHPPMATFLGVPILVAGRPYGHLYLTEKAGNAEFTDGDEQAVVVLAEFASVAIDHARRYAGASERRDELERTVATLEATTQIAKAIGGETDPEVVLELVAKRGRALVSARTLLIELVRGDQLLIAAGAGELPEKLVGERVELENSLAAQVMRTGRVQHLEDSLNMARFDEHGLGRFGVRAQAGLAVPLIFRGTVHGVMFALDCLRGGPSFSTEDERLLEAFAASAATAVATTQSFLADRRRQRLAATEAERQRWARELHDETLQSMSALRIGLSAATRSREPDALRDAVGQAVEHLEEGIANLRALITDLRPAALDELGAQAAIEALVERAARHGLSIDSSIDLAYDHSNPSISRHVPELEVALYRIVQEALSNAVKHGQAKRAVVEIHEDDQTVHLTVRDDGQGFDPDAQTRGFGLLGIRERVELLDGTLSISSSPGSGTTVQASFPVLRLLAETDPSDNVRQIADGRSR